eukprot:4756349-Prymnesium_polylepis.1
MAQHLYETGECLNMHDGINTFNLMNRTECGKALKASRCRFCAPVDPRRAGVQVVQHVAQRL